MVLTCKHWAGTSSLWDCSNRKPYSTSWKYPDSFINGAVYGILPMGMRLHAHSKRSYEILTSELFYLVFLLGKANK